VPLENKDSFLLHENGDIEGATKNISQKLGFGFQQRSQKQIKINVISDELSYVIQAFRKKYTSQLNCSNNNWE